ncbi:MAG: MotA/TolQ/ExbB proton channel family protein [Phycisphaerales bacterium JB063]
MSFTIALTFPELMSRGGPVMWVLLTISVVSLTLILERAWFFMRTNSPGRRGKVIEVSRKLRQGDRAGAASFANADTSVYGDAVKRLLNEPPSEAGAVEVVELQRARLERFLPTLSTIITAAPMLGILGTVIGIVRAFDRLSGGREQLDLNLLSGDIGEALITTAAGLVVALITLFPYNLFRGQVERSLSRLESLAASGLGADTGPRDD